MVMRISLQKWETKHSGVKVQQEGWLSHQYIVLCIWIDYLLRYRGCCWSGLSTWHARNWMTTIRYLFQYANRFPYSSFYFEWLGQKSLFIFFSVLLFFLQCFFYIKKNPFKHSLMHSFTNIWYIMYINVRFGKSLVM